MNPVICSIGPFEIRWYAVLILIGAIVGIIIAEFQCKKKGIDKNDIFDLAFYMILVGILCARLYYVLFNLSSYHSFMDVIAVWNGGLAIHGGIIGGAITMLVFCKKKKLSFLKVADITMPSVIIAQAIGRWGNFFNSEAHGSKVSLEFLQNLHLPDFIIKGMHIDGVYYHPTFLYESIWCLLGFVLLILLANLCKKMKDGQITCIYFMWYGLGRFFIEELRTDSLMLGSIKVAQLVSLLSFAVGLFLMIFFGLYKKKSKK